MTRQDDVTTVQNIRVCEGISDHAAIMCEINTPVKISYKKMISTRKVRSINVGMLREDPMMESLPFICSSAENVEKAISNYNSTLSMVLDKYAPIQKRCINLRPNTQWYNEEIASAKLRQRQLERKWRKSLLEIDRQLYCKQRQYVRSLLRKAKTEYHAKQVNDCGKDAKKLFQVVN